MTNIDSELIGAYLSTIFYTPSLNVGVKINEFCIDLSELLSKKMVKNCAFISSHNPYSVDLNASENYDLLYSLHDCVSDKYELMPYISRNPNYPEKTENGFLIFGIDFDAACHIGKKYEQNAFVWCEFNKNAELILLR